MSDTAAAPTPEPVVAPAATPAPEVVVDDEAKIWAEFEALENPKPTNDKPVDEKRSEHSFAGDPENAIDPPVSPPAAPAPAQAPTAAGSGTPASALDIWADAPPKLKAEYDAQVRALANATSDQSRRSIQGRITAYSRRLEEQQAAAAAPPPPSKDPEPDPLAPIRSDYPEFAEPLDKALAPLKQEIDRSKAEKKKEQDAFDAQMSKDLDENQQAFEKAHPGVWDMLRANGKKFGEWIVDQPLEIRTAVHVNRTAIVDLEGAVKTFDRFKEHLAALETPPPAPTPTPAPTPAPTNGLSLKREAQLAGSETPKIAGGRPTVSGVPENGDEQAIWNAFKALDPDEQKYARA